MSIRRFYGEVTGDDGKGALCLFADHEADKAAAVEQVTINAAEAIGKLKDKIIGLEAEVERRVAEAQKNMADAWHQEVCILNRHLAAQKAEIADLKDRLEDALEIVHGEDRVAELNAKAKARRDRGVLVPYPIQTLQQQNERQSAEIERLRAILRSYNEELATPTAKETT